MHADTEFAQPPQRRIGALAFIRNRDGRVLVVEQTYRIGPERWGLVGGCAHADEDARAACAREAREETGLDLTPGAILAVSANGTAGPRTEMRPALAPRTLEAWTTSRSDRPSSCTQTSTVPAG